MPEILCVTGTSGNLGSVVLHHLLTTLNYPPSQLVISTSHPSSVSSDIISKGVKVRHGDYLQPSTLPAAFAEVDKLLLISFPSMEYEIRVTAHKNAIDGAIEAGVKHIIYTSLAFNGNPTESPVMFAHRDTEEYLKKQYEDKKLPKYTIIREAIYSEVFLMYCGFFDKSTAITQLLNTKEIVTCCKGSVAYASIADLGEATAQIIASNDKKYENQMVLLSGNRNVGLEELASIISSALKLDDSDPLKVKVLNTKEFVDYNLSKTDTQYMHGASGEVFMKLAIAISDAISKGEASVTSNLLEELLGRPLKSIEQVVSDTLNIK